MKQLVLAILLLAALANLAWADKAFIAPDDNEAGPIIKKGYEAAKNAADNPRAEADAIVAGQKGAEECLRGLAALGSIVESASRKKYYDFAKAKLTTSDGAQTLGAVQDACKKMLNTLGARKVVGCGTKNVMVTQPYLGRGKWGSSSYSISEQFDVIACKEMPKRTSIARAASAHGGRFKGMCKGGVVVVDGGWNESEATDGSGFRAISGTCYTRGKLELAISSVWK